MGFLSKLFQSEPQPIEKKHGRIADIQETRHSTTLRFDDGRSVEVPGPVMERWGIYQRYRLAKGMQVEYTAAGRTVLNLEPSRAPSADEHES